MSDLELHQIRMIKLNTLIDCINDRKVILSNPVHDRHDARELKALNLRMHALTAEVKKLF